MDLFELFPKAVKMLQDRSIPFAVAGGFAAGLYRAEPRVTMDVDLGIALEPNAEQSGREILKALGLDTGLLRAADLAGGPLFAIKKKSTPGVMLVGRAQGEPSGGIDFLLPTIPWVCPAVERAQDHRADFGFGPVPVLRIEDVLLAKLYALQGKVRPKDLDDLQSILESKREVDWKLVRGGIEAYGLKLPSTARELVPDVLRVMFRVRT